MSRIESRPQDAFGETISAAQMRSLEAQVMASGLVTGRELMERAGSGVVDAMALTDPAGGTEPGRAVILCGPGNNGGDGYVVARLLDAKGWSVTVFALGDPARLPPDALANFQRWAKVAEVEPLASAPAALGGADVVVDALFGIGLTRALDADVADVLASVPNSARRIAIDVPSGWDTDAGQKVGNAAFEADHVVTFHAPKQVHRTLQANGVRVDVVDIGL